MGPNFVLDKGYRANGAIGQFRGVALAANDQVVQAGAADAALLGVSQDDVAAGDANKQIANIRLLGISRCVNGTAGALARRTRVTTDASGRVVAAVAGNPVLGVTLTAGAAQGDHVDVLLTPGVVA